MSKNKVILDICGVQLSLTTQESQTYMESIADKVRREINGFLAAGVPNREVAAVAEALDLYDRLEKQQAPAKEESQQLKADMEALKGEYRKLVAKEQESEKAQLVVLKGLKKDLADQEAAASSERDALKEAMGKVEVELVERDKELRRLQRDMKEQETSLKEARARLREQTEIHRKELLEQEIARRAEQEALLGQIKALKKELEENTDLHGAIMDKNQEAEAWRLQAAELRGQLEKQEAKAKRESDALCRELMELRTQGSVQSSPVISQEEAENIRKRAAALKNQIQAAKAGTPKPVEETKEKQEEQEKPALKNPLRPEYEQQGFVSFFEKNQVE